MDRAWEEAAIAYRETLAARPGWSPGYNQLALCALMLGHPEQAILLLQQALRLDPRAADIHTRYALMGEALLTLRRSEEAVEWLRRAVQAFPPPQTLISGCPRRHPRQDRPPCPGRGGASPRA